MKILVFSLHFVEYAVELANAISKENKVHLVLSAPKVSNTLKNDLGKILSEKVSYTLIEKYSGKNPLILINFFKTLALLIRFRPDIIHYQEARDVSNLMILVCSRFIPIVATIHDVLPRFSKTCRYVSLLTWFSKNIRKYLYHKIIVHGFVLKEELVKNIGRPDDIVIIPHGCLTSFVRQTSAAREEPHTLLFFGRMEKYKGLKYLIESL